MGAESKVEKQGRSRKKKQLRREKTGGFNKLRNSAKKDLVETRSS